MKKILVIVFLFFGAVSYSQVTDFAVSKDQFEFLPHEGIRILNGELLEVNGVKNIVLFSKPARGVLPDTLYVQKFVKKDEKYQDVLSTKISATNTIFLWEARKAFMQDEDSDLFCVLCG